MMKISLTILLVFFIGLAAGTFHEEKYPDRVNLVSNSSAYLIGAASITDAQRLPEYRAVAEPLAKQGGYSVLASGVAGGERAVLLEGEWPAEGLLFIERYDSMQDILSFVNSAEFQDAKLLRDQVAKVHFMLALEAGEAAVEDGPDSH